MYKVFATRMHEAFAVILKVPLGITRCGFYFVIRSFFTSFGFVPYTSTVLYIVYSDKEKV